LDSINTSEIVIAGAGPAGATASLFLCKEKIPHIILDKSFFPRDKTCGDALSGKVTDVLAKIDSGIHDEFAAMADKFIPCNGIVFSAPNGVAIEVPFRKNLSELKHPVGYVTKRFSFDDFLFRKIDRQYAQVIEGADIKSLTRVNGEIEINYSHEGKDKSNRCKLLIGAEGDRSLTARSLGGYKVNQKNYSAAVRAYYKGVKGLHHQNFIELHFLKGILPGYFWVFPLPNGEANVGVGIPSHIVSRKKTNLKNEMLRIIREHPVFKERFSEAQMLGEIKGWGLALGSEKRKISGDNFLLTGDAASLIDPFTGEGIGNAMLSGMKAAEQVKRCRAANRFDKEFLKQYDEDVYRVLWDELNLSNRLQKISRYPWLLNFLFNKATKNKVLRESIPFMFDNLDIRAKLKNPRFYLRLLFKYN
jgi:geranylgeranyl reductase family protein